MNVVIFLFIGLIAGWIAGHFMEGHGFGGIGDIIVGTIGAVLGGYVLDIFGVTLYGFWGSVATSVFGAIIFLFVLSLFDRPRLSRIRR